MDRLARAVVFAAVVAVMAVPNVVLLIPKYLVLNQLGLFNSYVGMVVPLLADAMPQIGHVQIRNRGTIGGSIALGEPAAEMPATAVALGASMTLRSVRGARRTSSPKPTFSATVMWGQRA